MDSIQKALAFCCGNRYNDNVYLNLFIKKDSIKNDNYIPYTFLPRTIDNYSYDQKCKILSSVVIEKNETKNK